MVPDQAEKDADAENNNQSGDDSGEGAAIAARAASRGRVVEYDGAFFAWFRACFDDWESTELSVHDQIRTL